MFHGRWVEGTSPESHAEVGVSHFLVDLQLAQRNPEKHILRIFWGAARLQILSYHQGIGDGYNRQD